MGILNPSAPQRRQGAGILVQLEASKRVDSKVGLLLSRIRETPTHAPGELRLGALKHNNGSAMATRRARSLLQNVATTFRAQKLIFGHSSSSVALRLCVCNCSIVQGAGARTDEEKGKDREKKTSLQSGVAGIADGPRRHLHLSLGCSGLL